MIWRRGVLLFTVAALLWGCHESKRPTPRRVSADAGVLPKRPSLAVAAPQPVPVTPAQRDHDRQHRAALQRIVHDLDKIYVECVALQARGAREPAFRDRWPLAREGLVSRAGRVSVQVLAVDPLSIRSWAAARAVVLLRYLTVKLPDAIRESWRARPSGAFATWRSDFRLIWSRLRRYVKSLSKKPSRPRSKDTK